MEEAREELANMAADSSEIQPLVDFLDSTGKSMIR
jgi:hypothetical protein